jgi:predicted RNA-binding protein with PUA-like domain
LAISGIIWVFKSILFSVYAAFFTILRFINENHMNYWLVKSEPNKYSWEQFNKDGRTTWDGVRNFAARNNLRAMKEGDLAFFYHSNEGKDIVGIAKVVKESYQDPTTTDPNWLVVDFAPYEALKKSVTLEQIKAEPALKDMQLVRLGRLSVSAVKREEFDKVLEMANS